MSGIAGVLRLDGAALEPGALGPAIAGQSERGRDGTEQWNGGSVALAQMWWRTSPASRSGDGPFALPDEGPVVVGDVRLDDRQTLLGALGLDAESRDRPVGDLELLARGYRLWGADLPRRLLGDFAFAVWDPKRHTLLCARDAFGVRPFVYHAGQGRFSFASRPAAMLALPWVPARVDELAVARYLVNDFSDTEGTFWQGVRRLSPGHLLAVDARGAGRPRPFFAFDPQVRAPDASPAEHVEAFRERFLQAVGWRLATDLPLGVEVSGGLDSASVAGAARLLGAPAPIPAYTVYFSDPAADERRFVGDVLAAGGLRGVSIEEGDLLLSGRGTDIGVPDSPYTLAGEPLEEAILRRAAGEGTGVVLSGFDGDTVVSHGVGRLTDLALEGRMGALARELRAAHRHLGWPPGATFRSQVISPLAPVWAHRARAWLKGGGGSVHDPLAGSMIAPDFARRVGLLDALRPPASAGSERRPFARREHLADLTAGINSVTLELLDHAGTRAGVEFRHPYFDRSLAELSLSLPGDVRFRDGWTRWVQRSAIHGLVPESVRWRPDKGMVGPTFSARFMSTEWDEVTRVARDGGGAGAGYLNVDALRGAYRRLATTGSREEAGEMMLILALERWLARVT